MGKDLAQVGALSLEDYELVLFLLLLAELVAVVAVEDHSLRGLDRLDAAHSRYEDLLYLGLHQVAEAEESALLLLRFLRQDVAHLLVTP